MISVTDHDPDYLAMPGNVDHDVVISKDADPFFS